MPRTKILRVRLNDPEWDALAALAAARGVSKSEAVRDLIKALPPKEMSRNVREKWLMGSWETDPPMTQGDAIRKRQAELEGLAFCMGCFRMGHFEDQCTQARRNPLPKEKAR